MVQEFDDAPAGAPLNIDHLIFYLKQGREIEFIYNEKEYFISNEKKGRAVWKEKDRITNYFEVNPTDEFNTLKELLDTINVDGKSLKKIFEDNEGLAQTIF